VQVRTPQPLTAAEAIAAAAAEGLELVQSSSNVTGFRGVAKHGGKYAARVRENGKLCYLGSCSTPEQAALSYARHVGAARAAAEAAEAWVHLPQPLTAAEAIAAAATEGLELVPSSSNVTGFKGVLRNRGRYQTKVREGGKKRNLGFFASLEEAALCYARHVGAARAAAQAAEARGEQGRRSRRPASKGRRRRQAPPSDKESEDESESEPYLSDSESEDDEEEEGNSVNDGGSVEVSMPRDQHEEQRGRKRQRALHQSAREQQPSSHGVGSHRAPRLTQVGDVETVIIDRFVFRCCAVRRCSP